MLVEMFEEETETPLYFNKLTTIAERREVGRKIGELYLLAKRVSSDLTKETEKLIQKYQDDIFVMYGFNMATM